MILGCFFCWSLASILYYHPYGILAYFYYQPSSSSWASYMHIHCPLDISNQLSTGILNVLSLLSSSSARITFPFPLFTSQKMIPVAQAKNSVLSFPTYKCVSIIILSLHPKYPKPWYFSLPAFSVS